MIRFMLKTQEYLMTHSLRDLQEQHGVYAKVANDGRKFSLNYDMIEFQKGDPIAEQCRGLILRASFDITQFPHKIIGETKVVAYPFDKFYNSSEPGVVSVDWSSAKVQEKLDGTLCILHHDSTKWCVATRSVPEANQEIDGRPEMTFRKLFELAVKETFGTTFDVFTSYLPTDNTYCFELTSPWNRVHCVYNGSKITLIGVRRNVMPYNEIDIDAFVNSVSAPIPTPKKWSLASIEEIQELMNSLSPTEFEGAVIVDSNFNRIKVKNINWVIGNKLHTRLGSSPRNVMRCILNDSIDDAIQFLPKDVIDNLDNIKRKLFVFFNDIDQKTITYKTIANGDRKVFAKLVNENVKWPQPCYQIFSGCISSTQEYVKKLASDGKLSLSQIDFLIEVTQG